MSLANEHDPWSLLRAERAFLHDFGPPDDDDGTHDDDDGTHDDDDGTHDENNYWGTW